MNPAPNNRRTPEQQNHFDSGFSTGTTAAANIVDTRLIRWKVRRAREYPWADPGQVETELLRVQRLLDALRKRGRT